MVLVWVRILDTVEISPSKEWMERKICPE